MPGEVKIVTLSRPVFCERAENRAEKRAGIFVSGNGRRAGVHHFLGAIKKLRDVESLNRAGNHAEIRKRGIAPADARRAEENVAETIGFGHLLHMRAGIGDGDEVLPGFGGADGLLHAFEEILLENIRLERAARLAGDDENCFREIELGFDGFDLRRIGGIENVKLRKAGESCRTSASALRRTGSIRPCRAARRG